MHSSSPIHSYPILLHPFLPSTLQLVHIAIHTRYIIDRPPS